jgi:hypothetical protein
MKTGEPVWTGFSCYGKTAKKLKDHLKNVKFVDFVIYSALGRANCLLSNAL